MRIIAALLLLMAFQTVGAAEPRHAVAMHGTPAYDPGFEHFDYVNPDAPKGGTLRRAMYSNLRSFNWLTENGADVSELQNYVHEGLATRDPADPTRWVPKLAYKITRSEDGRVYTIHLRERVWWHIPPVDFSKSSNSWLQDQREVTAEDVAFTLATLPGNSSPSSPVFPVPEKCTTP